MGSEPVGKLIGEPETGNKKSVELEPVSRKVLERAEVGNKGIEMPGSKVAEDIQTALEMAEAVQRRMLVGIHTGWVAPVRVC